MNAKAGVPGRASSIRQQAKKQAMESDMQLHHTARAGEPRLRVVFANTSIAMGLPAGSTLGDIAEWVGDTARLHNGSLRSIDVIMAARHAPAPAGAH
jgi:hypothetical protein